MKYLVTVFVEVEADSPSDAAHQAQSLFGKEDVLLVTPASPRSRTKFINVKTGEEF